MAITSSQDVGHKNYYLYRDTEGTGEWAITPWDVDLTWGRNWIDANGYFTDTLFTNNVLNFYNPVAAGKPPNRLFDLFFAQREFRQMYLRRLRTLMDTILMPPGTPTNALVIEPLVRQYEAPDEPGEYLAERRDAGLHRLGTDLGDTSLESLCPTTPSN